MTDRRILPNASCARTPRLSPELARIQATLNAMAESERMTQLVDYLDDLRTEFDAVAAELKALGFCAPCYFSELDNDGHHNCVERG